MGKDHSLSAYYKQCTVDLHDMEVCDTFYEYVWYFIYTYLLLSLLFWMFTNCALINVMSMSMMTRSCSSFTKVKVEYSLNTLFLCLKIFALQYEQYIYELLSIAMWFIAHIPIDNTMINKIKTI